MIEHERTSEFIHVWYRCHNCGMEPIVGQRFECQTCPTGPDNDLCEKCHQAFQLGTVKHPVPQGHAADLSTTVHRFRLLEGAPGHQYLPWLAIPQPDAIAPAVPDRFVVRPEFRCGSDSYFGSYAFVVESEGGPPIVLTALHVMDELIKNRRIDCTSNNASYTGQELPRLITRVKLYDAFAPQWPLAELGSASSMLVLPGARVGDEEPYSQRDIAAFHADPTARVSPARLAQSPPQVGQPLWLAFNAGKGAKSRAVQAVVVERTQRTLVFRYASAATQTTHSSGAPLLNSAGEVVGIVVGDGFFNGQRLGHANHVTSIRRHLGMIDTLTSENP
jgi:trypsin-like peptidase/ZZ type zinc finger protein